MFGTPGCTPIDSFDSKTLRIRFFPLSANLINCDHAPNYCTRLINNCFFLVGVKKSIVCDKGMEVRGLVKWSRFELEMARFCNFWIGNDRVF
jgi:hypothetical protein